MDGLIIVDKPQGLTSHDVVDAVRKKFAIKKVGHAGTLDPMATGVLVLLIGSYTKRSQEFMSDDKEYEGAIVLGASSDTGDAWGRVEPDSVPARFAREEVEKAFEKFIGHTEQRPPMYSAVKHKGRKLYEMARKGLNVEVEPRKIFIKEFKMSKFCLPEIYFSVKCSKGTYVRQLAVDVGKALGCGAYLSMLKRTASGKFTIDKAVALDGICRLDPKELEDRLIIL